MRLIECIRSKVSLGYSKYLIKTKSHTFQCGDVTLKYLFVPKKSSRTLITVFSGMNPDRASYNYINHLNHTKHNRLYILDDFGDPILGCYYLGTKEQFQVEYTIRSLLTQLSQTHQIHKYIFCGSSKGGYAALNFGIEYPDATIICAAPQYRLGDYLLRRKSPQLLHVMAGKDPSSDFLEALNYRLSSKLASSASNFCGKIFLHFSGVEHTYSEHIQYLLQDLQKYHYHYEVDRKNYPHHDDVVQFFPPYLVKTIRKVTE